MIMTAAIVCMAGIQMMAQPKLPYRNASLPIEERVSDLLSRMTLEEKVGQLRCTLAWTTTTSRATRWCPRPHS